MNNSKYQHIEVRKPIFFSKILSNYNGDKFSLNYFHNFQADEKLNKHQLLCKDHDYHEIAIFKKIEYY